MQPSVDQSFVSLCKWYRTILHKSVDIRSLVMRPDMPKSLADINPLPTPTQPIQFMTTFPRRIYIPIYQEYSKENLHGFLCDIMGVLATAPCAITYFRTIRTAKMLDYVVLEFAEVAACQMVCNMLVSRNLFPSVVASATHSSSNTLLCMEFVPRLNNGEGVNLSSLLSLFGVEGYEPFIMFPGKEQGISFLSFKSQAFAHSILLRNRAEAYEIQKQLLLQFGILLTFLECTSEEAGLDNPTTVWNEKKEEIAQIDLLHDDDDAMLAELANVNDDALTGVDVGMDLETVPGVSALPTTIEIETTKQQHEEHESIRTWENTAAKTSANEPYERRFANHLQRSGSIRDVVRILASVAQSPIEITNEIMSALLGVLKKFSPLEIITTVEGNIFISHAVANFVWRASENLVTEWVAFLQQHLLEFLMDSTAHQLVILCASAINTFGEAVCEMVATQVLSSPALVEPFQKLLYTLPPQNKKVIGGVFADHIWSFCNTSPIEALQAAVEFNAVDVTLVVGTLQAHLADVCTTFGGAGAIITLLGRIQKCDDTIRQAVMQHFDKIASNEHGVRVIKKLIDVTPEAEFDVLGDGIRALCSADVACPNGQTLLVYFVEVKDKKTNQNKSKGFRMAARVVPPKPVARNEPPKVEENITSDKSSHLVQVIQGPFASYPPTGLPFPPLPPGWTSAMSRSFGHYYFTKNKSDPSYYHPETGKLYRVTPQAFVLDEQLSIDEFLKKYNIRCKPEDFATWLNDQRLRSNDIESQVRKALGISSETEIARKLSEGTEKRDHKKRDRSQEKRR
eukprot:PhF_6_TR30543/c0_g1_i1/m.44831